MCLPYPFVYLTIRVLPLLASLRVVVTQVELSIRNYSTLKMLACCTYKVFRHFSPLLGVPVPD